MRWFLLICCLLSLLCSRATLADTLVVTGHTQELATSLIEEGGDVLAPLGSSLRLLGATFSRKKTELTITTPDKKALKLTLDSVNAQANGRKIKLAAAPREVQGELLLPARALAPWLQAEVRFDAATKTLSLHPRIIVTSQPHPDGVAILVRSAVALQFTSGQLDGPPRLFYDFQHAAPCSGAAQQAVGKGIVERLRIAQNSVSPNVARLVADCTAMGSFTTTVSEQGRLVTIVITDKLAMPAPEPAPVIPGAVKLLNLSVKQRGKQQTELSLLAEGPIQSATTYDERTRKLTITLANGLQTLTADQLSVKGDRVIERVEIEGAANEAGVRVIITLKSGAGYVVNQETTGVTVVAGAFDISDMVIVLDAGHGGTDTGAPGSKGMHEKAINLDVAQRAEKLLRNAGATVVMTRVSDTNVSLDQRPAIANQRKADIFISVHCNSTPKRNSASGTQTYYCTDRSALLAASMHTELVKGLGLKNGGVRTANFLVIRKSTMPAVLLELAFINNDDEEDLLRTPEFRQKAAEAILNGVQLYAASKEWQQHRAESPTTMTATTEDEPRTVD